MQTVWGQKKLIIQAYLLACISLHIYLLTHTNTHIHAPSEQSNLIISNGSSSGLVLPTFHIKEFTENTCFDILGKEWRGGRGGCSEPRDSIFEHNSLGEGKSVRENRFFSYLLGLVHT